MRRIVAILLIVLVVFLGVYGLFREVKAAVDGFVVTTVGPVFFNFLNTMYLFVVDTVGFSGFAAITLGFGFVVGIIAMQLFRKADLGLTRKLLSRRSKELGASRDLSVPATPAGATTRPKETTKPEEETLPPPTEEKKEEGKTA